jgi:hypothetical protein
VWEDRDAGLKTPAVRWGLSRTIMFGLILGVSGLVIMSAGLFYRISQYDTTIPYLLYISILVIPVVLMIGYRVPLLGLLDLYRISRSGISENGQAKDDRAQEKYVSARIKKRMNYPKWQASGIYCLFAVCILMFCTLSFFSSNGTTVTLNPGPSVNELDSVSITEIRTADSLDANNNMLLHINVNDINITRYENDIYVTAVSVLGDQVLENRTVSLGELRYTPMPGKGVAVDLKLKAHEKNDTQYSVGIYHMDPKNGYVLLDSSILEAQDEMFITNISYSVQKGLLKDTLVLDVYAYNRVSARNPYSLTIVVSGNLVINTISAQNNETVFPDSYWKVPTLRMDVPKGSATYKIKLSFNDEKEDLETVSLG